MPNTQNLRIYAVADCLIVPKSSLCHGSATHAYTYHSMVGETDIPAPLLLGLGKWLDLANKILVDMVPAEACEVFMWLVLSRFCHHPEKNIP